jgi:hypothetical protein
MQTAPGRSVRNRVPSLAAVAAVRVFDSEDEVEDGSDDDEEHSSGEEFATHKATRRDGRRTARDDRPDITFPGERTRTYPSGSTRLVQK